ncbi:ArgR family transcriptional regulator [Lacrimispora xylanisolvens]|uniref:Arginine repressor n=1 Tax=Lacrimispora xylanisolvens TaxID=384636 RepID=A0A2S6HYT7_9FIRM|nr:arginine repressor [Hungatella xylanolytica]PPK83218.1 ArgR family transcriptional regulator [Hungatella xylanolytica]
MNELEKENVKSRRQKKILELIRRQPIKTQTMLKEYLGPEGIHVTQATLSRDIREMNLIKGVNGEGYIQSGIISKHQISHRLFVLFSMAVRAVEQSGNVVVITCEPGMAASVCSFIDELGWNEIVGTIAGNNTIFVITREGTSYQLAEQFRNISS